MSFWSTIIGLFSGRSAGPPREPGDVRTLAPMPGAPEEHSEAIEALLGHAPVPGVAPLTPPPAPPPRPKGPPLQPPDPVAEFSVESAARRPVLRANIRSSLERAVRERFGLPSLHIRHADGGITYLGFDDAPAEGVSLIAAWSLREHGPAQIMAFAQAFAAWLRDRPEGFAEPEPALKDVERAHAVASRILGVQPSHVAIVAAPREGDPPLDGKLVWRILHGLGFTWGDMDQFQWRDPTGQTDDLLWAEADDGRIGFALPAEVAAGRQHFTQVRFTFDIARNPHAEHTVGELIVAAQAFAAAAGCGIACHVDEARVDGPASLKAAVAETLGKLAEIGVKPGSGSVCRLR
jgi:hypothetical protein